MQSMLVIGGAGFVGANLVRAALERGCRRVLVVDNFLSSERTALPHDPRVDVIEGSIADDRVLAKIRGDHEAVFHLATFHGNQNSIADPLADHQNNLVTTLKLYEHLKQLPTVRKVVYAASGCTLAPHTFERAEPVREDGPVPLDLDSPYQISKVVGEFYSVYYHKQHGLPTVRARFQNVYGPWEILGAGAWRGTPATVWRNVVPSFVYRALTRQALRVESEGKASRDFIYVDDIAQGLLRCADSGVPGDVYNLASGTETSIADLARMVNDLAGSHAPIEFVPGRNWDRAGRRVGSTEKAKRILGFEAVVGLQEGIGRTIDWTRCHLSLIESCIEKHADRMGTILPSSPSPPEGEGKGEGGKAMSRDSILHQSPEYVRAKQVHQPDTVTCARQFETIAREMRRTNNWRNNPRFLDIGCGVGLYTEYWHARGAIVTGIDADESQVTVARARAQFDSASIRYERAEADRLPFDDASFDIVFANSILEHVANWEACLQEWIRVLAPGGLLWIETTNVLCPRQGEYRWLPLFSWWPGPLKSLIVRLAERYPALANHSSRPALHWFSYFRLRRFLQARGMTVRDRFDSMDATRAGLIKRLARRITLSSEAGRAAAYLAVTPLVVLATKGPPARDAARAHPDRRKTEAGKCVEVT